MKKKTRHQDGPWNGEAVAIVGMAGRFPQARNIAEFWRNICEGRDCISRFDPSDLIREGVPETVVRQPNFVPAGGVLENIEWFDAGFFGISPREAETMDPQQRILLEVVQHALDDAGYDPVRGSSRVAVYAGCRLSGYWLNLLKNSELMATMGFHQVAAGNDKDFIATQVCYRFNFHGAGIDVQAACSTSLLAVALACDSLISGVSDVAIAGAASVAVPHRIGYVYQPGGIASPDGHCRPFDAAAKGSVLGNGVAAVVLKRLGDAVKARDRIYAVIRGAAINNDGAAKSSFAAPSVRGQEEVISAAFKRAGVTPADVEYVETHGTATSLGDAIEAAALGKVFGGRESPCGIGSVKSNVGHLDPAAGVTSLIKVALALFNELLPASIHFERPNPTIDFSTAGIRVVTKNEPWIRGDKLRIAGVSSFGIGGTNVHAVLQEGPAESERPASNLVHLLPLSANSPEALRSLLNECADYLESTQNRFDDIAFTACCGRRQSQHRAWIVAPSNADAAKMLRHPPRRLAVGFLKDREVFLLFPGQGAQRCGVGQELYKSEPVFRKAFESVSERVTAILQIDLNDFLDEPRDNGVQTQIHRTEIAQPFLFALEYATAQLWKHWGIQPTGMLGHSIGELVAGCLSEVFSLEDAVRLVCKRGVLMGSMEPGAMLAVHLDEQAATNLETDHVRISAFNAPRLCTLSASMNVVSALEEDLTRRRVEFSRLNASHAFHHPSMWQASEQFLEVLREIGFSEPRTPFLSNLTGDWITAEQATSPSYWAETVLAPVKFSLGVQKIVNRAAPVLIECGPGTALNSIVRSHSCGTEVVVVSSMPHHAAASERHAMLAAAGTVWEAGVPLEWEAMWREHDTRRVSIPPYPFQRERFWLQPQAPAQRLPAPAEIRDIRSNCRVLTWRESVAPSPNQRANSDFWLVLADPEGLGLALCAQLQNAGQRVAAVLTGDQFRALSKQAFYINPSSPEDLKRLLQECEIANGRLHLVYCWTFTVPRKLTIDSAQRGVKVGFHCLLTSLQAAIQSGHKLASCAVLTRHLFATRNGESIDPSFAPAIGIVRVLTQELPSVRTRLIDLALAANVSEANLMVEQVAHELLADSADPIVAYRGKTRFVQDLEPVVLPLPEAGAKRLRPGGNYIITGGLGGIGSTLGKLIASAGKCNLVLVGRRAGGDSSNDQVRELQRMGATVFPYAADISDTEQVERLIERVRERYGPIHGVIHAAGLPGGGIIAARKIEDVDSVFSPKVKGTVNLYAALRGQPPDFFVLCSSLASIQGGIGQSDYCGANAFQDAFAAYARAEGFPAISINWPAWREAGMAVAMSLPKELEAIREASLASGITNAEGAAVFASILAADRPQVVVKQYTVVGAPSANQPSQAADMPSATQANRGSIEPDQDLVVVLKKKIAGVWSEVLGIGDIKSDDNFFDLHGQSLMALQIVAAVCGQFPIKLELTDLFERPTLGAFTDLVQLRITESVANMPEERVQELLASRQGE